MNRLDLDGRVAVITGGASGIGLAIARRLVASGARLSLWDASADALRDVTLSLSKGESASSQPSRPHTQQVDVRDYAAVERARDATLAELSRIDILVTSAGITGPNTTTWDYPLDAWRDVIDVNLTGTFTCLRAIAPVMRAANYGRIVTIASVAGKEGNPNAPAYSASKAGVIALTKSLGKELATTGVRVNTVTPAAVESPMFAQMTQSHIDYMLSKIPMNRFGQPEEIAALVAWLCTEECSFSTGGVFDLSGGRSTY
ncbi:MAG TPA: SDR family NAD(P)-dependent oxidoreductase [Candidatus Elarobacter sp.]|nr:SDR family NAD(P)-dependent oxidoreductase [Candidatus Elarobacter sp.]